jgi:hypothetical protein
VNAREFLAKGFLLTVLACLFASCGTADLSGQEIATLKSLQQIDDYPLYTMVYRGAYGEVSSAASGHAVDLTDRALRNK